MKTASEMLEILKKYKSELLEKFGVRKMYIFGSYARGEQTPESDLDILVEFEKPIGWEIADLKEYLEKILGVEVDLVSKKAVVNKPLLWKYIEEDLISV